MYGIQNDAINIVIWYGFSFALHGQGQYSPLKTKVALKLEWKWSFPYAHIKWDAPRFVGDTYPCGFSLKREREKKSEFFHV